MNETEHYSFEKLCNAVHIARSSYYKWLRRSPSKSQLFNEQVVEWIKQHYEGTNGILGYRQMTITINRKHGVNINKKRVRRLMQILHLRSVTRVKKKNYIRDPTKFCVKPNKALPIRQDLEQGKI